MRKKSAAFILALSLLALAASTVPAAADITILEENMLVLPYYGYYMGAVFAVVQNTGSMPVQYNTVLLELLDKEANSLSAENVSDYYPDVLQPGEKGYIYSLEEVQSATEKDTIADYLLSIVSQGSITKSLTRFPVSGARYEKDMDPGNSTDYLVASVENNTARTVYGITVAFAARDGQGKLLYISTYRLSRYGLLPHTVMEIRTEPSWVLSDYLKNNNVIPASVEAIAYTSVSK